MTSLRSYVRLWQEAREIADAAEGLPLDAAAATWLIGEARLRGCTPTALLVQIVDAVERYGIPDGSEISRRDHEKAIATAYEAGALDA